MYARVFGRGYFMNSKRRSARIDEPLPRRSRVLSVGAARAARGFTLIEVLVVIAVIALVIGLFFPALGLAREAARSHKCLSNLRSIGQALTMYADQNRETFPYWSGWQIWDGDGTGGDAPGRGWTELLAEYTSGREVHSDPSRPKDLAPFSYFMQARFSYVTTRRAYTCLKPHQVTMGSQFVLAGDCNNPVLYARPYGTTDNLPDCDQDDATQPAVFFPGEISAHAGRTNLVMIDGHACGLTRTMTTKVTWHGAKMMDWEGADCGSALLPP